MTHTQSGSANWAIRHRPQTIADIVLPTEARKFFEGMIASKKPTSVALSGSAGIGKTTLAKAICNDLNAEVLFLHGSGKDRGIDAIKGKVVQFASMMSLDDQPKVIIMDEADNLTHDAQMALRSIIEEVADNCSFFLTCNFPGRLLDALLSRCDHIPLTPSSKEDTKQMKQSMAKRLAVILKKEEITFTGKAVVSIVNSNFPDVRKMLNLTQRFASSNSVDDSVAERVQQSSSGAFYKLLANKEFPELINWVMTEVLDPPQFAASLWPAIKNYVNNDTLPLAIVYINELQNDMQNVPDKHLALIACASKIMIQCEFQDHN